MFNENKKPLMEHSWNINPNLVVLGSIFHLG